MKSERSKTQKTVVDARSEISFFTNKCGGVKLYPSRELESLLEGKDDADILEGEALNLFNVLFGRIENKLKNN